MTWSEPWGTKHPLLGAKYPPLGIQYPLLGAKYPLLGSRRQGSHSLGVLPQPRSSPGDMVPVTAPCQTLFWETWVLFGAVWDCSGKVRWL